MNMVNSTEGNFTLNLLDVNESIGTGSEHNHTGEPTDQTAHTREPKTIPLIREIPIAETSIVDSNNTTPVDSNGTTIIVDNNTTSPSDDNITDPGTSPTPQYFRPLVRILEKPER